MEDCRYLAERCCFGSGHDCAEHVDGADADAVGTEGAPSGEGLFATGDEVLLLFGAWPCCVCCWWLPEVETVASGEFKISVSTRFQYQSRCTGWWKRRRHRWYRGWIKCSRLYAAGNEVMLRFVALSC